MSEILDLLKGPMGKVLVEGAASQLGMEKNKAGSAIEAALPLILGAMKNNASEKTGAQNLLEALENSRHNGGILDNLENILGGNQIDDDVLQDGEGILGHVFGNNQRQKNVATAVSKSSGIDMRQALNILKVAAPVVMGLLGKEKRQQNITNPSDLQGLLGGLLGGNSQQSQSMVTRLLDADGDGSIIDDVAGMLLNSGNKKNGGLLGNVLGSIFGGK